MVDSSALDMLFGASSLSPKPTTVGKPAEKKTPAAKKPATSKDTINRLPTEKKPRKTSPKTKDVKSYVPAPAAKKDFLEDHTFKPSTQKNLPPMEGSARLQQAERKIIELVTKYGINLIVIGNGTASRESEQFIADVISKNKLDCKFMITSEAGASVYSASELGNKEYPDLDVTVRGAISIAHRVQDPLAELIKIDPKSIGVGQYQHDVDQKMLQEMLDKKIEDTVNRVGVDINTASVPLLTYVSGLTAKTAQAIVDHRDATGPFVDRKAIKKVKGLGPKAYEQAIGFLRVKNSHEPLDATGIHPETYEVTYKILDQEFGVTKKNLKLPHEIKIEDKKISSLAAQYEIGDETLRDIIRELANPGLDPREHFDEQIFRSDIKELKDLEIGTQLTGVVRNITDFGAFVDVGLHSDGLVHKSQMADHYVSNPMDVVTVGQSVTVRVLSIDLEHEKVSLTMKKEGGTTSAPRPQRRDNEVKREEKPQESTLRSNMSFTKG